MIKGYRRLPYHDWHKIFIRFTKQYKNGHIQLYDVVFPPCQWRFYPATIDIKNTMLNEIPIEPIEKEILQFMKSSKFKLKEDDEMTEEEQNYYYPSYQNF